MPNPGQDEGGKRERGTGYDLLQSFLFEEITPPPLLSFLSSGGSSTRRFFFLFSFLSSRLGFKLRPIDMNTKNEAATSFHFFFSLFRFLKIWSPCVFLLLLLFFRPSIFNKVTTSKKKERKSEWVQSARL